MVLVSRMVERGDKKYNLYRCSHFSHTGQTKVINREAEINATAAARDCRNKRMAESRNMKEEVIKCHFKEFLCSTHGEGIIFYVVECVP